MRFRNSILSSSNTVEAVRPKPPTSQKSQELNRSPPHPALPSRRRESAGDQGRLRAWTKEIEELEDWKKSGLQRRKLGPREGLWPHRRSQGLGLPF